MHVPEVALDGEGLVQDEREAGLHGTRIERVAQGANHQLNMARLTQPHAGTGDLQREDRWISRTINYIILLYSYRVNLQLNLDVEHVHGTIYLRREQGFKQPLHREAKLKLSIIAIHN